MSQEEEYLRICKDEFSSLKDKTKNAFRDFFRRLSGIETPIGGITWTPKQDEREVVYQVIQHLADHRLVHGIGHEGFSYSKVIASLEKMREQVTAALVSLGPDFDGRESLERVRAAFHHFQGLVEKEFPRYMDKKQTQPYRNLRGIFVETCVAMQKAAGSNIRSLAEKYSIKLTDDLKREFSIFEKNT